MSDFFDGLGATCMAVRGSRMHGWQYLVHALRRDARVRHATKPFIQHSLSVAIGDTLEGLDSSVVMPLHNRRDSPPRRF